MKRMARSAVLLASALSGCFLFPLKDPPCSDGGACQDGGGATDLAGAPDLTPPPDLMPPPDLKPLCVKQSDCSGGLTCVAGLCQACSRHSQCDDSLVCDVYLPQPGAGAGRCLAPGDVLHVDNNAADCAGADGTRALPFCTIVAALARAGASPSSIRVAASNKDYGVLAAADLAGKTATLYGPAGGDDGKGIATLGQGANVDAVVMNSGTTLTLDGLELRGGMQGAVNSNLANATLTIRRSKIIGFAKLAVRVVRGTVRIDRTSLSGNLAGVLSIGANTSGYSITNSFIIDNRIPDFAAALSINASGTFRYNTIVNNTNPAPSDFEAAIDCSNNNAVQIEDSIVLGNTPFRLADGVTQFKNGCTLKGVVVGSQDKAPGGVALAPDFESQSDLRLRDTDASKACCIDKGMTPSPVDYYGTPRATAPDIGAHELR